MHEVHIYAESDKTFPRNAERKTGYVLECAAYPGRTRDGFKARTGTYNAVILQTLIEAIERVNQSCEIHIHTQNSFILDMIDHNLLMWAGNDFRNAKGDMVKNHIEWRRLWGTVQKHMIITEQGAHSYYSWMMGEMSKIE